MRTILAGLAFLVGLSACHSRRDDDTGRKSVDTTVTTRLTQDTTIVTSDTVVRADTVTKEGE